VNTEITDKEKLIGWVLYDCDCRLCTDAARRFKNALWRRHFELLPLQTPWIRNTLRMTDAEMRKEMRLLKSDGEVVGGADALLEISGYFWWAWPIRQIGRIPPVRRWMRAGYQWVADHRRCADGVCVIDHQAKGIAGKRIFDFLPLLVLPSFALVFRARLAPWIFMWAMAFALYAGCKWLSYRVAIRHGVMPRLPRTLGYLFAWPGMDAADFLDSKKIPAKPRIRGWIPALLKTAFGLVLVWKGAGMAAVFHPTLAGWIGMIGVVFMLHFGLFHCLSLAWRRAGVMAAPVMQNPLLAGSLADFWGGRWNTAFNELAFRFTYRPLRRWATPAMATMGVFVISGFIHESVISLPARGGYGLPTLYFFAQGLGVIMERSRLGRLIGLGRGLRGWLFIMLILTGPLFWLFHPAFINHVILPMLKAIGAT
jgi:alginate O-acetyltransferase complex protein AlgI